MDEFTKTELERINQLYGNDFEGITPQDAILIGRWEAHKATQEAEFQAQMKAYENEALARIETNNAIAEQAFANLNELHARALDHLERVENGI